MTPEGFRKMFIAFFLIVFAVFIISPLLESYGTVYGLNGTPGIIEFSELWKKLNPFSAVGYYAGDLLCHQEFERSLILNGSQMPVCIRDIAALAGLIIGMMISNKVLNLFSMKNIAVFTVVVFIILIADILIQSAFSLNIFILRAVTGILAGVAVGILISHGIRKM